MVSALALCLVILSGVSAVLHHVWCGAANHVSITTRRRSEVTSSATQLYRQEFARRSIESRNKRHRQHCPKPAAITKRITDILAHNRRGDCDDVSNFTYFGFDCHAYGAKFSHHHEADCLTIEKTVHSPVDAHRKTQWSRRRGVYGPRNRQSFWSTRRS